MKILQVHNTYQFQGGEDRVRLNEQKLLEQHCNEVAVFEVSNNHITTRLAKIKTALDVKYSEKSKHQIAEQLQLIKPNIVHIHNFFPLLTPSIYDACIDARIPIIQTLHNYRTICPGALLLRDKKICEICISKSPYNAVLHRCYRNSFLGSWSVARMVSFHRKKHTWNNKVNRFITMTHFSKDKFINAGFPEEKILIKPHFTPEPTYIDNHSSIKKYKYALFVGRLSTEKGIMVLINAWENINYKLIIIGDGPLLPTINTNNHINFIGKQKTEKVSALMEKAAFVIAPSTCYETFGMVIIEAFSHKLPVICSNLGSMAEIVENSVTGLHFEAGNSRDLTEKINWMIKRPVECRKMGNNAYTEYLEKYTPSKNYNMLINIYQDEINNFRKEQNV